MFGRPISPLASRGRAAATAWPFCAQREPRLLTRTRQFLFFGERPHMSRVDDLWISIPEDTAPFGPRRDRRALPVHMACDVSASDIFHRSGGNTMRTTVHVRLQRLLVLPKAHSESDPTA